MKSRTILINALESFGYPVFLQGSLNGAEDYPESFFTFWNFSNDDESFYSNSAGRSVEGYWVYFYSTDPELTLEMSERAREALNGSPDWVVQGKPFTVNVDVAAYTGAMFTVYYIDKYETE